MAILLIHGGATNLVDDESVNKDKTQAIREICKAIPFGLSASDMAEYAVLKLENYPAFNAGKGAFAQRDGIYRLDACFANSHGQVGGVIGMEDTPNPIAVARQIALYDYHAILGGSGARAFADEEGFEKGPVRTRKKEETLRQRLYETASIKTYKAYASYMTGQTYPPVAERSGQNKNHNGTVGAVVLDDKGNLAAAGSTGGNPNCVPGRIGDTGIYGQGIYCDKDVAIAMTGHGDKILRHVTAKAVAEEFKNNGRHLALAAKTILNDLFEQTGGQAGLIAVSKDGQIAMDWNTKKMFYAAKGRAPSLG